MSWRDDHAPYVPPADEAELFAAFDNLFTTIRFDGPPNPGISIWDGRDFLSPDAFCARYGQRIYQLRLDAFDPHFAIHPAATNGGRRRRGLIIPRWTWRDRLRAGWTSFRRRLGF